MWSFVCACAAEGVPGCYAVKVLGDLPDSIKDDAHRFAFAE